MFYHGTDIGGLTELKPNKSNEGEWVYLSDEKLRILPYCVNPLRVFVDKKYGKGAVDKIACRIAYFWFKDNKLILTELYPGYFEEIYKGQKAYIYSFENVQDLQLLKKNVFGYKGVLPVENVEVILDMYEYLSQLEKEDKLVLRRQKDMSKEELENWNEYVWGYFETTKNKYALEFYKDKVPYIHDKVAQMEENDKD